MKTGRLEAFSDGVLAIIITIMVLEMKAPEGAHWTDLKPLIPHAISYLLSFIYVGIYWNNHHHLFQRTSQINGKVLWANLGLLFILSLLPIATGWMGENSFEGNTVFLYGVILLLAAVAWYILIRQIINVHGNDKLKKVYEKDKKTKLSIVLYAFGLILSFLSPRTGLAFFYLVALLWVIPDIRLERLNSSNEQ